MVTGSLMAIRVCFCLISVPRRGNWTSGNMICGMCATLASPGTIASQMMPSFLVTASLGSSRSFTRRFVKLVIQIKFYQ